MSHLEIRSSRKNPDKAQQKYWSGKSKGQRVEKERVWRKGNPLTLLVGMQTRAATLENSVKIS